MLWHGLFKDDIELQETTFWQIEVIYLLKFNAINLIHVHLKRQWFLWYITLRCNILIRQENSCLLLIMLSPWRAMIIISLILMICAHLGSETAQGSLQRCVCLCSHLVWGTLAHCCIELESYMFRKISESSSFVLRWQGFFPQKLKLFLELNVILVNCIFNVHNNLWKQFLPQFSTTHLLSVV